MQNSTILVCEDIDTASPHAKIGLQKRGYRIINAPLQKKWHGAFQNLKPDMVIVCSLRDDFSQGLNAVRRIRKQDAHIPVIMINRKSSEESAIQAFKAGVDDYFKVPVPYAQLEKSINTHLHESLGSRVVSDQTNIIKTQMGAMVVGDSPCMQEAIQFIRHIASTDSTVLITGETGVGKELAASAIHENSNRSQKPMVCVNCAALPENLVESELYGHVRGAFTGAVAAVKGKFEQADHSSLFLDEIGDMSLRAQAKILRTLETRQCTPLGGQKYRNIDFRVIAATNQDLEQSAFEKKFRKDLYFRLNVARVHLPPLRKRRADIPYLIDHYINHFNPIFNRQVKKFTPDAVRFLMEYEWPGNVRELKNVIEAAFVSLPPKKTTCIDLPPQLRFPVQKTTASSENERLHIVQALMANHWNKTETAKKLSWSRMTLYRKMEKYHIVEVRKP